WVRANETLRREIMSRIRTEGPLRGRDFENRADRRWESTGWTGGRDVDQMLDYLWIQGRLMVTRRQAGEKVWDLSERVLPAWMAMAGCRAPRSYRRSTWWLGDALSCCSASGTSWRSTFRRRTAGTATT